MAAAYYAQGQHDKTLGYYGKALRISLATLGDNHPDTATTLANLGATQIKMGNRTEGKLNIEKANIINKAALGLDHPETKKWVNYYNTL